MAERQAVYQAGQGADLLGTVHLTIPGLPPSVNHLYPTVRGGRVLSTEARAWYVTVADACMGARIPPFPSRKTLLMLELRFVGMTYQRDISNAIKAAEDALAAALGFDDRYVAYLSAARVAPEHKGQVETRVSLHVVQEVAEP
jgi:hypothetical protein